MVEYPSGQRGQTVNLLANAFEGSNPSSTTIFFGTLPLKPPIMTRIQAIFSFFGGALNGSCLFFFLTGGSKGIPSAYKAHRRKRPMAGCPIGCNMLETRVMRADLALSSAGYGWDSWLYRHRACAKGKRLYQRSGWWVSNHVRRSASFQGRIRGCSTSSRRQTARTSGGRQPRNKVAPI